MTARHRDTRLARWWRANVIDDETHLWPTHVPGQGAFETYLAERDAAWQETSEKAQRHLFGFSPFHEQTRQWLRMRRLPDDHGPRLALAALAQYEARERAAWRRYMDAVTQAVA